MSSPAGPHPVARIIKKRVRRRLWRPPFVNRHKRRQKRFANVAVGLRPMPCDARPGRGPPNSLRSRSLPSLRHVAALFPARPPLLGGANARKTTMRRPRPSSPRATSLGMDCSGTRKPSILNRRRSRNAIRGLRPLTQGARPLGYGLRSRSGGVLVPTPGGVAPGLLLVPFQSVSQVSLRALRSLAPLRPSSRKFGVPQKRKRPGPVTPGACGTAGWRRRYWPPVSLPPSTFS